MILEPAPRRRHPLTVTRSSLTAQASRGGQGCEAPEGLDLDSLGACATPGRVMVAVVGSVHAACSLTLSVSSSPMDVYSANRLGP